MRLHVYSEIMSYVGPSFPRMNQRWRGEGRETKRETSDAGWVLTPENVIPSVLCQLLSPGLALGWVILIPYNMSITNFSMKDGLQLLYQLLEMDSFPHKRPNWSWVETTHHPLVTCLHWIRIKSPLDNQTTSRRYTGEFRNISVHND